MASAQIVQPSYLSDRQDIAWDVIIVHIMTEEYLSHTVGTAGPAAELAG